MTQWTATLDDAILAPGRYIEFTLAGQDAQSLPPLAAGDTFALPFHGGVLKGSVISINRNVAIIAIEGARYRIKHGVEKWLIAARV